MVLIKLNPKTQNQAIEYLLDINIFRTTLLYLKNLFLKRFFYNGKQ